MKTQRPEQSWLSSYVAQEVYVRDEKIDPGTDPEKEFFYIGLEDIETHTGQLVSGSLKTTKGAEIKSLKNVFSKGDVLYGRLRPALNKVYLADRNGVCSTDILVLQCLERLTPEFLHYYLRTPLVCDRLSQYALGGQLPRVSRNAFNRVPIPLPAIPEQKRIVEILSQADSLRRQRQEILNQVKKLPTVLFLEMFGNPITNPQRFNTQPLSKLGDLDRGVSKHRPRDASFLYGGDYPFIQTGDVTNSDGWISTYSQTYSEAGLAQSRLWPAGTLCITIAANIAKTGILEFDACFPDSVVGFVAGSDAPSEYVMFAINLWQGVIEAQAPRAAQKNINLKVLRSLRLPVPPMDRQLEFSLIVKE